MEAGVGASIGIVFADGMNGAFDHKHAADLALYKAKREGRGTIVQFDAAIASDAHARHAFERDLGQALERGELEMHYQVQHDLRSNLPVGYEALMRWNHPDRGMVPPMDFIPMAEELGLIGKLGRWALVRAACDIACFDETSRVSVNVSPVQFTTSNIVGDIRAALDESGLDPSRLEIEVTEAVLICDTDRTHEIMRDITDLGVGISLDDFGSGYSSLGYLTRFPFTKIKIDRSFIMSMHEDKRSENLVRSILALAGALDLKVTAEGVETHRQLMALVRDRCDEAQGFLIGRPTSIRDLRESRALIA